MLNKRRITLNKQKELNQKYNAAFYDNMVKSWQNNARDQNKMIMIISTILLMFTLSIILISNISSILLTIAVICFVVTILLNDLIYHLNFKVIDYIIFDLFNREYDKKKEKLNTILCKISDIIVPISFITSIISLVLFVIIK